MVVPSACEQAMETFMMTFHNYSGSKDYMDKQDLKKFLENEFPEFLKNQKDPLAVDKIMKDLDQCRDGRMKFYSYVSLIAGLTIACNEYYATHIMPKK